MSLYRMQSSMTTEQDKELNEIICKAIPITPSDCKQSRARKEQKRRDAKERILSWYERIRTV